VEDARLVYQAIRQARPSGMGTAEEQDLDVEPTVTLREAMALAAGRDLVAREYVTDYALTFETGVPALRRARAAGRSWEDAVVETYLALLVREPDTLIARKLGYDAAAEVSAGARAILDQGDLTSAEARSRLAAFDASLRDAHNSRNPGTTADLTAAALFVVLLEAGTADDPRTSRAQ
jgi:triphosphoribosyl-dephospho-CoA synthase